MASSDFLCFLSLLSLLPCFISSSPTTISIPLSHFRIDPYPDSYQKLTHLASLSITRAHHLKNPPNSPVSTTPLSSHSYGGYSISLSFGTPPQTIPFIVDTGSHFVWFPCTHRYFCKNCSNSAIPSFIPKSSSSAKKLGCVNPKCGWVHNNPDVNSRCSDCQNGNRNCTQICPPYLIMYGSGATGGIVMVETLDLPGKKVPDFLVGCSLFSSRQPAGIAGFGRGQVSLPSQLGLTKFSYCLLSRKFDDTAESTSLVLDATWDSGKKTANVSYTPMLKNPSVAGKESFSVFYYVSLKKIIVGGKKIKIPSNYVKPGNDGNGGMIVDSGTTFTYMANSIFELVIKAFVEEAKGYERAEDVEARTGLRPCFNISGKKNLSLPEMRFHFREGAEMVLPLANYFLIAGEGDGEAVCLAMVSEGELGAGFSSGPSIILGSFQMQNYFVEFDLRNDRFGFRQQSCK